MALVTNAGDRQAGDPQAPDPRENSASTPIATVTVDSQALGVKIVLGPGFPSGDAWIRCEGAPVWSGWPVSVIGGVGLAFDPIPPLGGSAHYEIEASDGSMVQLVVATPSLPAGFGSLTPRWAPDLAVVERTVAPTPDLTVDVRNTFNTVPGDSLQAASWDIPTAGKQTWTFACGEGHYANAIVRRDKLMAALTAGPFRWRPDRTIGLPELWALATSVKATRDGPLWMVVCEMQPVRAPSMAGAALVSGATYQDALEMGTYADVQANGTYGALAGMS